MSQPVIEVKNLSKVYNIGHEQKASAGNVTLRDTLTGFARKPIELITGHKLEREKFWALNDVNFEINQGEAVGIIGRNGSGKSTMLKVLSRIVEPTKGEIHMRGKVASLLEVGTGFHPELTGRENIFFNGAILGMKQSEIKAKFNDIVEFSEVEKFLDTPVKFYSSGMYVRLAFAVAAHLDPDILIVDEVLAVGDAAFQEKCLGKMKDVASSGRTILFVSHNMPSVRALCTKAIWMESGQVRDSGDLETVTDNYALSLAENVEQDLSKRVRTSHVTGEAKITSITVSNPQTDNDIIDSKKSMDIRFEIKAQENVKNVLVHCGVNAAGSMVLRFMSEFTDNVFDLKKGHNTIICNVPASHLSGGVYTVDCSLLHPGQESVGHIDEVFDAATFVVTDYEVPEGKQFITQREAAYYTDHAWKSE